MALAYRLLRAAWCPAVAAPFRGGRLALGGLGAAASFAVGCTPSIGDRCTLSTDCSIQGNRLCDTTQPGGYCTMLRCTANSCPDNAACVEFAASVPGCPYDDYSAPSRTASAFCMKTCGAAADCRQSDGYSCLDPQAAPWYAVILDNNRSQRVCILQPADGGAAAAVVTAPVCSSQRPDASPLVSTASVDAGSDGGEGADASDGADAFAGADGGADSGAIDGSGGG